MKNKTGHWTNDEGSFLFYIADEFIDAVDALQKRYKSREFFLSKLGISKERFDELHDDPSKITLKEIVVISRSLGMKPLVTLYEDLDFQNEHGPVPADVFTESWKYCGKPRNFRDMRDLKKVSPRFLYIK